MKDIAKAIVIVGLSGVGVIGMHLNVEGAGWALFVGLIVAVF